MNLGKCSRTLYMFWRGGGGGGGDLERIQVNLGRESFRTRRTWEGLVGPNKSQ